jgi:hypothetical protein
VCSVTAAAAAVVVYISAVVMTTALPDLFHLSRETIDFVRPTSWFIWRFILSLPSATIIHRSPFKNKKRNHFYSSLYLFSSIRLLPVYCSLTFFFSKKN